MGSCEPLRKTLTLRFARQPAASTTRFFINEMVSVSLSEEIPNFSRSGLNDTQVQFSFFKHLVISGLPISLMLSVKTWRYLFPLPLPSHVSITNSLEKMLVSLLP